MKRKERNGWAYNSDSGWWEPTCKLNVAKIIPKYPEGRGREAINMLKAERARISEETGCVTRLGWDEQRNYIIYTLPPGYPLEPMPDCMKPSFLESTGQVLKSLWSAFWTMGMYSSNHQVAQDAMVYNASRALRQQQVQHAEERAEDQANRQAERQAMAETMARAMFDEAERRRQQPS